MKVGKSRQRQEVSTSEQIIAERNANDVLVGVRNGGSGHGTDGAIMK